MTTQTPYHAGQKKCASCQGWFDPEDYEMGRGLRIKISEWCLRCRTESPWEYVQATEPPSHLAQQRLRHEAFGNQSMRVLLWQKQGGKCHYCKQGLSDYIVEHKTPISRGGDSHPTNLALSCRPCNAAKGTLTEWEYRAYRKRKAQKERAAALARGDAVR